MTNMFWNKWNNDMRGYSDPNNNYNQNTNSNNWNEPKQTSSDWNWNYFSNPQPKQSNPSKSFDPTEFINTEFMNTNKDYRADGNKTHRWDTDKMNTNYKKTSYSNCKTWTNSL